MEGAHHRTFNLAKSAAMAFLRDVLGRTALWSDVAAIPMLPVTRRKGHPCTVTEARAIAEQLGSKAGPMWWAMCITGMGKSEYLYRPWVVRDDHIEIPGTKRAGRDRIVPLIEIPARPTLTYAGFNSARRYRNVSHTLYDARRTYAHWLEMAGIPRSRRHAYMGHKTRDVLDLYEDHGPLVYVKDDAQKLRKLLGITEDTSHLKMVP